jgi:CheY-like chemotaxis protein
VIAPRFRVNASQRNIAMEQCFALCKSAAALRFELMNSFETMSADSLHAEPQSTSDLAILSKPLDVKAANSAAPVCSLVGLISLALDDLAMEAANRGVVLSWAVDPLAPLYIAIGRVDPTAVMNSIMRLALAHLQQAVLHLSIFGGQQKNTLEIILECDSDALQLVSSSQWQQLSAWLEPLHCILSVDDSQWRCIIPIQTARLSQLELGAGPKVLLLSSDTDTRHQTVRAVRDFGHDVIECNEPDEALSLCKQHDFALVLIDADLRGALGLQFARNLRIAAPSQPLLALLSSSVPDSSDDFDWIKLWMHKPPRKSELALGFAAASARIKKKLRKAPAR